MQKGRSDDFDFYSQEIKKWLKTKDKWIEIYLVRDTDIMALTTYMLNDPKCDQEVTLAIILDRNQKIVDSSVFVGANLVQDED